MNPKTNRLERISRILNAEADAIRSIPLNQSFSDAVEALIQCRGKIFTTGIGKAGYIAKKAASTFCTIGSPSIYLHPGDGPHGDVGAVTQGDTLICLSNSGKNREVGELLHICRTLGLAKAVAITARGDSPLAKACDVVIEIGTIVEPCPLGLTPTASAAAMLAVCDALALLVMEERGFTREDFALRHHGGYIGHSIRQDWYES